MSKKKSRSKQQQVTSPRGAKRNRVQYTFIGIALAALVIAGFATILRPQQAAQTTEQGLVSSDAVTAVDVENSEISSAVSSTSENSVADDAAVAEKLAADLPIAPAVGALAPDFELATINGEQLALADMRGKPMFISFFHSW